MVGYLVAGFVIGTVARLVDPGSLSLPVTLGLGIVGSLVGGLVARPFSTGEPLKLDVAGFVLAAVVAVLFIGVAEGIAIRNRATT